MWVARRWTRRTGKAAGLDTGTKISGIGHLLLIGWAVLGGTFRSEPLPFEVQDVSVISSAEFAAMMSGDPSPEPVPTPTALIEPEPDAPETPEQPVAEPEPEPETTEAPPVPEPFPEPEPEPEAVPDPTPPEPDAEIAETPPEPSVVTEDVATLSPLPPVRPRPRPVDRIAPEPVAAPAPETTPDEEVQPEVSAEEGAETPQPEQEATAPEEATDRIDPEAEETAELAPARSRRPPKRRPDAPKPAASATDDAVLAALRETAETDASGSRPAPAPTGPPLTAGEKDNLRVAVSRCWNVGSLSSAALATTVTVAVTMQEDGKPVVPSIRLIEKSGGDDAAAKQAFGAARRAIIRCSGSGYELPSEKYAQWREIEMTFNPERMRIR